MKSPGDKLIYNCLTVSVTVHLFACSAMASLFFGHHLNSILSIVPIVVFAAYLIFLFATKNSVARGRFDFLNWRHHSMALLAILSIMNVVTYVFAMNAIWASTHNLMNSSAAVISWFLTGIGLAFMQATLSPAPSTTQNENESNVAI